MVYFEASSRYLLGGTEENHEKHQTREPVSGPRFEPGTSRILLIIVHRKLLPINSSIYLITSIMKRKSHKTNHFIHVCSAVAISIKFQQELSVDSK
jgi:hypothetical protein